MYLGQGGWGGVFGRGGDSGSGLGNGTRLPLGHTGFIIEKARSPLMPDSADHCCMRLSFNGFATDAMKGRRLNAPQDCTLEMLPRARR